MTYGGPSSGQRAAAASLTLVCSLMLFAFALCGPAVDPPPMDVRRPLSLVDLLPLPPDPVTPVPEPPLPSRPRPADRHPPHVPAPASAAPTAAMDMTPMPLALPAPPPVLLDGHGAEGQGSGSGTGSGGGLGLGGTDGGAVTHTPVLLPASWARRPSGTLLRRYNPVPAGRERVSGTVLLACHVRLSKSLTGCRILSEQPEGHDFGAAALAASTEFRINPPLRDGVLDERAWVAIPVSFNNN